MLLLAIFALSHGLGLVILLAVIAMASIFALWRDFVLCPIPMYGYLPESKCGSAVPNIQLSFYPLKYYSVKVLKGERINWGLHNRPLHRTTPTSRHSYIAALT